MNFIRDPISGRLYQKCDYAAKNWCRTQGRAMAVVTVQYNHLTADTLNLCEGCARFVTREARRHGYKVSTRRLT